MFRKIKNKIINVFFEFFVLFLPKHREFSDTSYCISTLLCQRDVNLYIFSINSFFFFCKKSCPLVVIDDGTLTNSNKNKLRTFFPFIEIISVDEADLQMEKKLQQYRWVNKFRFDEMSKAFKRKLDCLLLPKYDRTILLDADTLFHKAPIQIIDWITNNRKEILINASHDHIKSFFTTDLEFYEYSIRSLLLKHFSVDGYPLFNMGLCCISSKKLINVKKLDLFFSFLYEIYYAPSAWNLEETAFMLLWDKKSKSHKLLSEKYYLNTHIYNEYIMCVNNRTEFIHYVSTMKRQFKKDAIRLTIKNNFFKSA